MQHDFLLCDPIFKLSCLQVGIFLSRGRGGGGYTSLSQLGFSHLNLNHSVWGRQTAAEFCLRKTTCSWILPEEGKLQQNLAWGRQLAAESCLRKTSCSRILPLTLTELWPLRNIEFCQDNLSHYCRLFYVCSLLTHRPIILWGLWSLFLILSSGGGWRLSRRVFLFFLVFFVVFFW